MTDAGAGAPPTTTGVQRIAGLADPVIRNLEITQAYFELSTALHGPVTENANWCTFATWASQQAGRTVRGEDLVDNLERRALLPTPALAVAQKVGRWLVRRGLFNPETRLGRLANAIHGPLDGLEAASREIALGNQRVFEEIGLEFARYLAMRGGDASYSEAGLAEFSGGLRPGAPPDGQDKLREAFTSYYRARFTANPAERAQLEYLANVQIGFHEQIRLQPQIESGMTDPVTDEATWGLGLLASLFPGSVTWWAWVRNGLGGLLRVALRPVRKRIQELIHEVVTEHMMTLTVAGRVLSLAEPIPLPPSPLLERLDNPELTELLATVPPPAGGTGDVGARDWSDLGQRMRYIANLFRVYQGVMTHDTHVLNTRTHNKERIGQLLEPRGKDVTHTDAFGSAAWTCARERVTASPLMPGPAGAPTTRRSARGGRSR